VRHSDFIRKLQGLLIDSEWLTEHRKAVALEERQPTIGLEPHTPHALLPMLGYDTYHMAHVRLRAERTHEVKAVDESAPSASPAAWTIAHGFAPVFGGNILPDGSEHVAEGSVHGAPLSWIMSDLWARELPFANEDWASALVEHAGLLRGGRMARALERIALHKDIAVLESRGAPLGAIARYAIIELLAACVDERGRLDPDKLRSTWADDSDRLIGWVGGLATGRRIKQFEDAPYELEMIDPLARTGRTLPGMRKDAAFKHLPAAIDLEERARRAEHPMRLLPDLVRWLGEEKYWAAHRKDFIFDEEHVNGSSAMPYCAERYVRVGKGYSTSASVVIHEARVRAQSGRAIHFMNVEELGGDAVFGAELLGLDHHLTEEKELERALFLEGLRRGSRQPFHHFQVITSGAKSLLLLNRYLQAKGEARPSGDATTPNWFGFGTREEMMKCVSGVEHTRDGARKLKEAKLCFPVVNVAESPVKLRMAALLLAWANVEELLRSVREHDGKVHRILVNGFGSMGSRAAILLRELNFDVLVKETDPAKAAEAREMGFTCVDRVRRGDRERSTEIDLVAGTVGLPSLDEDELEELDHPVIFSSMSSSNKEIPFRKSRGWTATLERARPGLDAMNADWIVERAGVRHLALNSLYAVDMTRSPDSVAPEWAQIIRALITLGSYQGRALADAGCDPRLYDLDAEGQRFIADGFMKEIESSSMRLPKRILELLREEYRATLAELDVLEEQQRELTKDLQLHALILGGF
jgi:hypothetical protein